VLQVLLEEPVPLEGVEGLELLECRALVSLGVQEVQVDQELQVPQVLQGRPVLLVVVDPLDPLVQRDGQANLVEAALQDHPEALVCHKLGMQDPLGDPDHKVLLVLLVPLEHLELWDLPDLLELQVPRVYSDLPEQADQLARQARWDLLGL